jgi:hypothetical protein
VVAVVSEVQVADVAGNLDELPVVYDLATCEPVKPYTQPIYVPGSTAVNYLYVFVLKPGVYLFLTYEDSNKATGDVRYSVYRLIVDEKGGVRWIRICEQVFTQYTPLTQWVTEAMCLGRDELRLMRLSETK